MIKRRDESAILGENIPLKMLGTRRQGVSDGGCVDVESMEGRECSRHGPSLLLHCFFLARRLKFQFSGSIGRLMSREVRIHEGKQSDMVARNTEIFAVHPKRAGISVHSSLQECKSSFHGIKATIYYDHIYLLPELRQTHLLVVVLIEHFGRRKICSMLVSDGRRSKEGRHSPKSSWVTCIRRSRKAYIPASVHTPFNSAPEHPFIFSAIFLRSIPRVKFIDRE